MNSGRPQTVIGVIERTIGPLEPDTIASIDRISPDTIAELKYEYNIYRDAYAPPVRRLGELRPFAPVSYMRMGHGLNPARSADLSMMDDPEKTIDRLHLHLLYAHSIALQDPLLHLLDFIPSKATSEDSRAKFLERLQSYLIYVSFMRTLIDSDIVALIPADFFSPWYGADDFTRLRFEVADKVWRAADFSDIIHDPRRLSGAAASADISSAEDLMKPLIDGAINSLMAAIELNSSYGGNQLDLYIPFKFWKNILMELASESSRLETARSFINDPRSDIRWSAQGWTGPRRLDETLLVREVAALKVNDFNLSAKDIIAVRRGDEFEEWRNTLRDAMLEARRLYEQGDLQPQEVREAVAGSLAAGQSRLQGKIGRSRFLVTAREGFKGFGVGTLSALLLAPWISPKEGIAKAAATGVALGAVEAARARRPEASLALLQHYLQFSQLGEG
jgi:hypothetical protein